MFTWNDMMKNAVKAKHAAGDLSSEHVLDAMHADQMRSYVAEHVFGIRRRSTFAAVAQGAGLVILGAIIGGGLMAFLARTGPVKAVVSAADHAKSDAKNDVVKSVKDAKEAVDGFSGHRAASTFGTNDSKS
jgi:hypothetical protein